MNILGIGSIVEGVGKIADDLITSDEERAKIELESKRIDAGLLRGQMEINKAEAKNKSVFVAGARPAVIWVGAFSLAWAGIIHPLLMWIWAFFGIDGSPPPMVGSEILETVMIGLLGIGGMRSFDKAKGTQTDRIK